MSVREYTVTTTSPNLPSWRIVARGETLGALRAAVAQLEQEERCTVAQVYYNARRVSLLGPDEQQPSKYTNKAAPK